MTRQQDRETLTDIVTGSGGIGVLLIQLSVITGLLPALLLALAATAIVVLPGLAIAVLALPAYGLWRLAARPR